MVYQSEKTLDEMGEKLDAEDKQNIEAAVENVKTALNGTDTQAIKDAVGELEKAFHAASEKLYSQPGSGEGAPGPDFNAADFGGAAPGGQSDDVYDADYEVVDDD